MSAERPCLFLILCSVLGCLAAGLIDAPRANAIPGPVAANVAPPDAARISPEQAAARAVNNLVKTAEGLQLHHPRHLAEFTAEGVRFTPRRGPEWRWQLVAIGSEASALADVTHAGVLPQRGESGAVRYARGTLEERYVPRQNGVEQQFVLHAPLDLAGVDLVVAGAVESAGDFEATGDGWQWRTAEGAVTLGGVRVFDARGEDLPATMTVAANATRITVDGAALARATYPVTIDPEIGANDFRISDMGPDGDAGFYVGSPAVAYNPAADEYLVVWSGSDNTGAMVEGESEIFGQRINASTGEEVGANDFRISDLGPDGDTNFRTSRPAVAYNSNADEYLVVWQGCFASCHLFANESEIFGQRLTGTGAEIGPNDFRISDMGPEGDLNYTAIGPAVAYNSRGDEYLVVWVGSDTRFGVPGSLWRRIQGQRLRIDGATVVEVGENDFGISRPDTIVLNSTPDVIYNSSAGVAGEYLVVWAGFVSSVIDDRDVFGQRLDASTGEEVGTNDFRISDLGTDGTLWGHVLYPVVAYNPSANEYLVVWWADDNTPPLVLDEYEIFGQRLDASTAVEVGANDFRISDMGPDGDTAFAAIQPAVAYNTTADEYLVVWGGDDDTGPLVDGEREIFGQRLTSAGVEVGVNDFRISDMGPDGDTAFAAGSPAVAYNTTADEYLVVWGGDDDTGPLVGGEGEIFGQLINLLPPFATARFSGSLILHGFGNDDTTGTAFPWTAPVFIARPLGAPCLTGCGATTLQAGAPLQGSGTVTPATTTPRPGFTLPASKLSVDATGSLPVSTPYLSIQTYASGLRNATGLFAPGGGPGSYRFTPPREFGGQYGWVDIKAGPKQFGGTMRLLGSMYSQRTHGVGKGGHIEYSGRVSSFIDMLGRSCVPRAKHPCSYPLAEWTKSWVTYNTPSHLGKYTTATVTAWGMPWTTGTISVHSTRGHFDTDFSRKGYDNRTFYGAGTIQLVAPHMVHWDFANRNMPWDRDTGMIAVLNIKFVPEPTAWLLLAAGMGLLGVLYRARARGGASGARVRTP